MFADQFERDGEEDVKVGAVTYHCAVWKSKENPKIPNTGSTVWLCPESKEMGGLVRLESWDDAGTWNHSAVMKLADTGRVVEVCGRRVTCHVIQATESREGEEEMTTTEEIASREVPGGTVKRTVTQSVGAAERTCQ